MISHGSERVAGFPGFRCWCTALIPYASQPRWLSLMNTGDGRALLSYGGVVLHGRLVWWLKNVIDRRFMGRFQQLEHVGPRNP